jgi:serine/threonine protein kinase
MLRHAKDLAEALKYCHHDLHPEALIMHRDIKPENIGLNAEGRIVLFDWGLCRCVLKQSTTDQPYHMTGMAGSLRYMAPEVVLKQPYTEKADVYSYALVVWAMAQNDNPYKYYDRKHHYEHVVINHERPPLNQKWPSTFKQLLRSCWQPNSHLRPSFIEICEILSQMLPPPCGEGTNGSSGGLWDSYKQRRNSSMSTASSQSTNTVSSSFSTAAAATSSRIGRTLRNSFNSVFSFNSTK